MAQIDSKVGGSRFSGYGVLDVFWSFGFRGLEGV